MGMHNQAQAVQDSRVRPISPSGGNWETIAVSLIASDDAT